MADSITIAGRSLMLGDKKWIGLRNIAAATGSNLTGISGTVTIYDEAGSVAMNSAALTVSYSSNYARAKAVRLLQTGPGLDLTASGTYRAVYTLTFSDLSVVSWQQTVVVFPKPY